MQIWSKTYFLFTKYIFCRLSKRTRHVATKRHKQMPFRWLSDTLLYKVVFFRKYHPILHLVKNDLRIHPNIQEAVSQFRLETPATKSNEKEKKIRIILSCCFHGFFTCITVQKGSTISKRPCIID